MSYQKCWNGDLEIFLVKLLLIQWKVLVCPTDKLIPVGIVIFIKQAANKRNKKQIALRLDPSPSKWLH